MFDDGPLTGEEIKEFRKYLEIEKIKKTKLLYSQLMDSRDIDGLAQIFAEDALCEFGPYGTWNGRREIHENYKQVFKPGGAEFLFQGMQLPACLCRFGSPAYVALADV